MCVCVSHRYDNLIARFPEDFRGYLAKGVFLRDKGRRADAERMFLQVRGHTHTHAHIHTWLW